MLLKLSAKRVGDEQGFALPAVIAIFAIVAIVSLTLAGMAVHALGFSTSTRASVQSRAAADSGVNVVLTQMQQQGSDLTTRFPCSVSPASATIEQYTAKVHYFDASGTELSCAGAYLTVSMLDRPVKAVIDSTGTAAAKGVAGQSAGDTRVVTSVAKIDIKDTPNNTPNLNKSVFSDGPLTVGNGTSITDSLAQTSADVYSNGDVTCSTSQNFPIQGSVYAQGNVQLNNPCTVQGDVWAAGTYSAPGNVTIGRNLLLGAGGSAPYQASNMDTTWVGGSVVSNGSITLSGAGNQLNCSLIGAKANVCGSATSLTGSVNIQSGGVVGGDAQSLQSVSIAVENKTSVYGNVRSVSGGLTQVSTSNKNVVGGYVAVAGTIGLSDKKNIGNLASTCGASAAYGSVPHCPSTPQFSIAALPTEMNYPTNMLVPAPPRETLPTITSTLAPWESAGWVSYSGTLAACTLPDSVYNGTFSGKLIVVVSGCSGVPLTITKTITLSGDLVVLSPTGFDFEAGNNAIVSNAGTHEFQGIVPTDGTAPSGDPLVTWSQPITTDPSYYKPACATGLPTHYGNVYLGNNFSPASNTQIFFYTPCEFETGNNVGTLNGEVYSGTSSTGNSESVNYVPMTVPGALKNPNDIPTPTTTVTVTELSRFDAKG